MFSNFISYVKSKKLQNISYILVIALITITGIYLRIEVFLYNQGFWNDEILLAPYNIMEKTYFEFFKPLNNYQVAPPFFLIVTKFFYELYTKTNGIEYCEFGVRFIPLLSSILAVPAFFILLSKIFNNKYVIITGLMFFSLNTAAISYSQEAKQYSTELLFSIILLYIFYTINFKEISLKKIILYSLVIAISPWFSLSSTFIIATGCLFLVYESVKDKTFNKKYVIFFVPIILSILCWYFMFYTPTNEVNYSYMQSFWSDKMNGIAGNRFLNQNGFEIFYNQLYELIPIFTAKFLTAILFITGIFILFAKKYGKILFLTLAPVILCCLFSYFEKYPFTLRLILFLLPSFIIIISSAAFLLKDEAITKRALIIFCICTVLFQFKGNLYRYIINRTYIKEHYDFINNNSDKISGIITFHILDHNYYSNFYNKKIKIYPIAHYENKREYDDIINGLEKNKLYLFSVPSFANITEYIAKENMKYFIKNKKIKVLYINKQMDEAGLLAVLEKI